MTAEFELPGERVLLTDDARRLLAPVVAEAGGRLLQVRRSQVRHQPGRCLFVRYAAEVERNGSIRTQTLGAVMQTSPLPADVVKVDLAGGGRAGVWRYPHDPFLPGLPAVAGPKAAGRFLAGLGLSVAEPRVQPVVYRAGRRAVLRVSAGAGADTMYIKVVRPGNAARLQALHEAFAERMRVPLVLGIDDDLGLAVVESLPGVSLTTQLLNGGAIPPPAHLVSLVERLSEVVLPPPAVAADNGSVGTRRVAGRTAPGRIVDHAATLAAAVPHEQGRIAELVARTRVDELRQTCVHGDFYDRQILVGESGAISGVLDLDGAGVGSATDDAATLLGHLVALAHVHPTVAPRIDDYRQELQSLLARRSEPHALYAGVTGVLLGLATTPFRRQVTDWPAQVSRWLDVAQRWSTRRLDARSDRPC